MRKKMTASQTAILNIRKRLRQDMERLALTHKGCKVARGCGCLVDKALTVLDATERQLFIWEIDSYADQTTPRRIVQDDNTILIDEGGQEDA